jgi:DNA-binding NarL/FixJ family response regulator
MRDSMCLLLTSVFEPLEVYHADDSVSVLGWMVAHPPALVLLDTSLNGVDLSEVLAYIRSNGARTRCLVLADSVRQRREARRAGADAVLLKGFPIGELFQAVSDLLDACEGERGRTDMGFS